MVVDWIERTIEESMESIIDYRGKTPKKVASGVPLVTAKIVKGGRIASPEEFIAESDYFNWMRRGLPKPGDVVITTEAPLGEVAQLGEGRIALAQRLICLRGKPSLLDNRFLKYQIQSESIQRQLQARASGTTVLGIRQSELRQVVLRLPQLAEQRAIGHLLGTLDDKIEFSRQMNETLEEITNALFKSWFVDFDPVQSKLEQTDSRLPPAILDIFPGHFVESELGDTPCGWPVQAFSTTVDVMSGGTPKTSVPEYWGGDIPWFSVVDAPSIADMWAIDTEKRTTPSGVMNSSAQVLPIGTTILSARGTVGKVALVGVPMAMNQSCYGLRGKQGSKGLYNYYSTRNLVGALRQHAHGSVFDTITRSTFDRIPVVVPPKQLVDEFERLVAPLADRILLNLYQSRTLAALRDTLLPKLISGELRIKDAEHFVSEVV